MPEPAAYESGYLLFRSATGDTLYSEEYTDWCEGSDNLRIADGGLSLPTGPTFEYLGYKSSRSQAQPLFGIYRVKEAAAFGRSEILEAYLAGDDSIFQEPDTYYVISCTIDGESYTSHVVNYREPGQAFLVHADTDAVMEASTEYFYPDITECRRSNEVLIRTDLHYSGQLYRTGEPRDSVAVDVDMLVNIGF